MVIIRTPYRISFFGGGTDFPAWYREQQGQVLSTTIDKYCRISLRYLPPFFKHRHRVVYSKVEEVNSIAKIKHPSVKACFTYMNVEHGLELHHDGDLPARSGIGSSSAFTVGLLHGLYALSGAVISKKRLAMEAIHVEQDILCEHVGSQDQVAVTYGGLNHITFRGDHNIVVNPIPLPRQRRADFQSHLLLFFTGLTRFADEIEADKMRTLHKKTKDLETVNKMVEEALDMLSSGKLDDFGALLDGYWKIKRGLSRRVSTSKIDEIYRRAMKNGALGGKLLGAGGGGFLLFFAKPENHEKLLLALGDLTHVPFGFDDEGSKIIHFSENEPFVTGPFHPADRP